MNNLWHPFTAMQDLQRTPQLSIAKAEGNYLIDSHGNSYLDGISSLWTNIHGHNHPFLNQAMKDQIDKVSHTTLLGLTNPEPEGLAKELVQITPEGLNHVFYSDSGSTAVEIALKQAFQYWQIEGKPNKTKFIHLDKAYHGDTLGAVSVGGIDLFHEIFGPLLINGHCIPSPCAKLGQSHQEAMERSLEVLHNLLKESTQETAALIIEPLVQGAGGILVHPKGYLSEVAKLCARYEVLLIADEVATGFGRTGKLFACEHENVKPDLLCLAKGITGGYLPLAATLSTDKIYNAFLAPRKEGKTFFHGHTYTGNPLACAVARANLELFKKEDTIKQMQPKIEALSKGLNHLKNHSKIGEIRQRGFMVGIEIVQDKKTLAPFNPNLFIGHQICMAARSHKVIIRNLGDVIVLMPILSINQSQIQDLLRAVEQAIEDVLH